VARAALRAPGRDTSTIREVPPGRLVWIDTLKVVTIAGVVTYHAATAYLTDVAGWYYEERTTSQVSAWLVGAPGVVLALFLLGPLFLLGGVLATSSLARSGTRRFVRSRLVRLGGPLLVFVIVIDPLADLAGHTAQGLAPGVWETVGPASEVRDVGPMWFVAALLTCSLVYAVWRRRRPLDGHAGDLRPGHLAIAAAALAAASFLVRVRWPLGGEVLLGLRFGQWPQAAVLFAVGVLLGERGDVQRLPTTWTRFGGRIACAGMLGVVLLGGLLLAVSGGFDPMLGGWQWASAVFALLEATTAIAISLWVVDHARRWWPRQGPGLGWASRGAYGAYVLHPLVLVALSWAARPLPWPPEGKFLLVAVAGVLSSFAVGWTVTRATPGGIGGFPRSARAPRRPRSPAPWDRSAAARWAPSGSTRRSDRDP
jgi:glucans biosynthesis protein C